MVYVEDADGEEKYVEEHELPVTVYSTVSPHGSRADYEIGHPEARGGMMYFYCTRCHEYTNPRDLPPGRYGLEELK